MRDKIQFQNILEKYFNEWEQIKENGMYDFLCTDGELLNTIRYSIINLKKGIENELDSKDYPNVYYRATPPEVSDEFMVGSEEIRKTAAYNLNLFEQSFRLIIDMAKVDINDEQAMVNDKKIVEFVEKYRNAIENNDLITMKWLNRDFTDYYQSMGRIFGLVSLEKLDILQEEEQPKEEIGLKLHQ